MSEPPRSMDPNHIELTDDDLVWQYHSLPLGNGYLGACVYGYEDDDRIQITDNSFANPYKRVPSNRTRMTCGLTSFANLYLHFGHGRVEEYNRELDLSRAVCTVSYKAGGVSYKREYFTSYPDRALVIKVSVDRPGALNLSLSANVPYIGDFAHSPEDEFVRTGRIYTEDGRIVIESELSFYDVKGYGTASIRSDGTVTAKESEISVAGATEAVILYTMGTNYRMESRVFTEPDEKKKLSPYPHPKNEVKERMTRLESIEYSELYKRHIDDYVELYSRSAIKLSNDNNDITISDLLSEARNGNPPSRLVEYLYSFGRYLLIASSRQGALPSNLQGVWTNYRSSPWSAGYWHNINVQMNYWPSAPTNIAECFLSYSDYNTAYMDSAMDKADEYLRGQLPEQEVKHHENGWIIGTGAWPYMISGASGHSGPGTGAFTSLLFWDYYDYTRDVKYLREKAYPVLRDMSLFFSKTLDKYEDKYLVTHSASPEQVHDGKYYATVGCAFDQQMIYENYKRTLEAAEILGIEEPLLDTIREQIDKLDPILIGLDGQIKEFREEEHYGDIGEEKHRHISHLVALYPGCSVNEDTPEFMDAARYSLMRRGDGSSGWSASHRLLCYARLGDGESCYRILKRFMQNYVTENLWTQHPPFQIDGSFGITVGIAEMLLQSQAGYIRLLPAIPEEWKNGEFTGLVARGNFVVDCKFEGGVPYDVKITSRAGGKLHVKGDFTGMTVRTTTKSFECECDEIIVNTMVGDVIHITK